MVISPSALEVFCRQINLVFASEDFCPDPSVSSYQAVDYSFSCKKRRISVSLNVTGS